MLIFYYMQMMLCFVRMWQVVYKLEVLERDTSKWGMNVNVLKSKVVVFRNGGIVKKT